MISPQKAYSFHSEKLQSLEKIRALVVDQKNVGLTIGGFDLFHPWHMLHLEEGKQYCDILVVGVASDETNHKRKGEGRPILSQILRSYQVSKMEDVDYVFINELPSAVEAIHMLRPNVYIKGPDYAQKTTPGIESERKAIAEVGGKIVYTQAESFSTSQLEKYIQSLA